MKKQAAHDEPVFVPPGTPRRVSFGAYAGAIGTTFLLIGFLFTLIGGGMTVVFLSAGGPFWEDWTIDARGVPATAIPDGVHATSTRVNRRMVHEISFHYLDADGLPHSGTSRTTDGNLVEAARQGARIPIHYVPGEWRLVRADGTKRSLFGLVGLAPLLFAGIGLAFLFFGGRGVLRRRRLYIWGQPATGRVLSVTTTNTRINGRPLLRTRYSFDSTAGPIEGSMDWMIAPKEGAVVTVLYDQNDPTRSLLPVPGAFGV